jgi:hypothetical protein
MSSNSPRECFVYITLPGKVSAVTAGKFVLDQTSSGGPLGRFVYGQSYLKNTYDLTPSPVVSLDRRDLALVCGDRGRFANAKNILSQHARFLLQQDEAEKIIRDTREQVGHWYDTVRACGASENDAEAIRGAFIYPGFSY